MRWIPAALLLLASSAFAADRTVAYLKSGGVAFDAAQKILVKANSGVKPAERHRLLRIAARWNRSATEFAKRANQWPKADTRAFGVRTRAQRFKIEAGLKQFRASTDIVVQPVRKYRPTVAIVRQSQILKRNQKARKRALSTRANDVRMSERDRLNAWRRAQIRKRLANGLR